MPSEERFGVVKRLLDRNGWVLVRVTGSHHIFKKPNAPDVVFPVHHGKVKPFYVRQIKKLLENS